MVDGIKTGFWKDNWHEKGNLEELFPDVNNLVTFQFSRFMDTTGVELQLQKTSK